MKEKKINGFILLESLDRTEKKQNFQTLYLN